MLGPSSRRNQGAIYNHIIIIIQLLLRDPYNSPFLIAAYPKSLNPQPVPQTSSRKILKVVRAGSQDPLKIMWAIV